MGEKRIIPYTQPYQFDGPVEFNDTVTLTGEAITGGTFASPTITDPTITGTTSIATGATIAGPAITGAATVASGATITTPTIRMNNVLVTATGATGSDSAALTAVVPAFNTVTGTSGMGVGLPTGPTGAVYVFRNNQTGILNIYCVGGTINGTTGTTAVALSATGSRLAVCWCSTATGAWTLAGNT